MDQGLDCGNHLADGAVIDRGAQGVRLSTKDTITEDKSVRPLPAGELVRRSDAAHGDDGFEEQRHAAVDCVSHSAVGRLGALAD